MTSRFFFRIFGGRVAFTDTSEMTSECVGGLTGMRFFYALKGPHDI